MGELTGSNVAPSCNKRVAVVDSPGEGLAEGTKHRHVVVVAIERFHGTTTILLTTRLALNYAFGLITERRMTFVRDNN